jgi:benzoate 4-monooxygenase
VIGSFAFGKSFGFTKAGKDLYNLISTIDTRGEVLNALGTVPAWLRPYMKYNYLDKFWSSGLRAPGNLAKVGRAAYLGRKNSQETRKDMLSFLFNAKDADTKENLPEEEILAEAISFIVGGSDTTSSTMTNFIDIVSRNQDLQKQLQTELDEAFPDVQNEDWVAPDRIAGTLPLLNATLKEVMRIRPTSATGLERIVPPGGRMISGKFIPEGVRTKQDLLIRRLANAPADNRQRAHMRSASG